jgi:fucose 4-O-acetylase-like acetyltransferase
LAAGAPKAVAQGRHPGLDGLRGLLMLGVVIGHFPTSAQGRNPFGPLPEWIYFIHIPLFLALSALFIQPLTAPRARRRALQILVPFVLWLLLGEPERLLRPLALVRDLALGNWASTRSILWFLPALLTSNLLMALWRRPGPRLLRPALALLMAATFLLAPAVARQHPRIPFGLDVALFLFPFVACVDFAWRRRQHWQSGSRPWTVAALLTLPVAGWALRACEAVKTHSAFARRVDFAQFSVPETVPGYLAMTLMGLALLVLAGRLRPLPALAALGRASMPIYLLHYPLLFGLSRSIGVAGESRPALLAYGILVTLLTAALPALLARGLVRRWPWTSWIGMTA